LTLLRDDPDFATAFGRAAEALNRPRAFVEKDYWVTQVVRALHGRMAGGFLLKGGTSLSKGYDIIDRFSEDVDILVVPTAGVSVGQFAAHLLSITETAASDLGLDWEEARAPGHGRDASRGDYMRYPSDVDPGLRLPIRADAVLLETGFAGGHEPAEMVELSPILAGALDADPSEYEDMAPFMVRVLEPVRTLVEKLFAVHNIATAWSATNIPSETRFGRHYYDIYRLLEHAPTLRRLRDRDLFEHILGDVERISRMHFGGVASRPEGGFAASRAFIPERQSELRFWLVDNYTSALSLLPESARPPTFGRILQRVNEHADLL